MSFEATGVERKVNTILKILDDSTEALGARIISRRLKEHGVTLTERAVRYHLKMMDGRGLTEPAGKDGRLITRAGHDELTGALVKDKVGLALSRIELLAFRTSFNPATRAGLVPVNVSLLPAARLGDAWRAMRPVFDAGITVSRLVALARAGETIGDLTVPPGQIALGTVCSVVVNGTLLQAGIPIDSRFGGILEMRGLQPHRFTELIHYSGSSLDPSEVFIRAGMTDVTTAASGGSGKILANFREIPAACYSRVSEVVAALAETGINGLLVMGQASEPVGEVPMELNRIGMILVGGLNPIAACEEAGIPTVNKAMSTLVEYADLVPVEECAA